MPTFYPTVVMRKTNDICFQTIIKASRSNEVYAATTEEVIYLQQRNQGFSGHPVNGQTKSRILRYFFR